HSCKTVERAFPASQPCCEYFISDHAEYRRCNGAAVICPGIWFRAYHYSNGISGIICRKISYKRPLVHSVFVGYTFICYLCGSGFSCNAVERRLNMFGGSADAYFFHTLLYL